MKTLEPTQTQTGGNQQKAQSSAAAWRLHHHHVTWPHLDLGVAGQHFGSAVRSNDVVAADGSRFATRHAERGGDPATGAKSKSCSPPKAAPW